MTAAQTPVTGPVAVQGAGAGRAGRRPLAPPPRARKRTKGTLTAFAYSAVAVAGGIGVWWAATAMGLRIPSPPQVAQRAVEMAGSGLLLQDLIASLRRVALGFAAGTALAVPVGFLMGWYTMARRLVEPYVQFFRMIPPLALLPLSMVLFGIGETAKVWVIFLGAFLSCVISTYQGVVGVDVTLIGAARVLGARDAVIFARVVVPASTPFILVGMRIGLGAAWATVVASELLAAQAGLGARMLQAQIYYDMPTIFVCVLTIGVVGLVMDRVLLAVERRLTRWQERRS